MRNSDTERLRAHWISVLEGLAPNYFLTFNFGYKIHVEIAEAPVIRFCNMIQRRAYGRDWAAQFNREWPVAYGFFEHPETNPHWHVLTRLDGKLADVMETEGTDIWLEIQRRGQLHVEEIESPHRSRSYCLKDRNFEHVFIYSDTRKRS
jgi:hypothetical protein